MYCLSKPIRIKGSGNGRMVTSCFLHFKVKETNVSIQFKMTRLTRKLQRSGFIQKALDQQHLIAVSVWQFYFYIYLVFLLSFYCKIYR